MVTMRPCPHCGTENSAQKRICFQCGQEIRPPAPPRMPARPKIPAPPAPPPAETPIPPMNRRLLGQRAQFYRQMQAQLHAGIPPGHCLSLIEGASAASWRPMLRELARETQGGGMLSTALARYPLVFPEWEISVVRAGEIGGTLPDAMADIAESLETEVELRLQTHARTFHLRITAFVMALVACIVFRARAVLPLLLRTGKEINSIAEFFYYFYPAFRIFAFIVLGYLLLLILWRALSRTRRGGVVTQAIIRRVPFIGPILAGLLRLRFVSVLGTLWGAGVSPMEAIQTAARASDDPRLMDRIAVRLAEFSQGAPLSAVLAATGYFSPEVMYLVNTGETSGSIPRMLRKISEYTHANLDNQLKSLPMRAQLLLYAIMAPIIGYLVVTTWQWYFEKLLDMANPQ